MVLTATGDRAFCTGANLRARRRRGPEGPEGAPERPVGTVGPHDPHGGPAARGRGAGLREARRRRRQRGPPPGSAPTWPSPATSCSRPRAPGSSRSSCAGGITPDGGGAYLLPRLVGLQKAKELVFFGDDYRRRPRRSASGWSTGSYRIGELEATAAEWAGRLAAGPTPAISLSKALLNRSLDVDRTTAFAEEAAAQEIAMTSEDAAEGVRSFVERRPPRFRGW